jgi:hypothetical protein
MPVFQAYTLYIDFFFRILKNVLKVKIAKTKYMTKNNTTDPDSLFLKITRNTSAMTNDRIIFTPIAIKVAKTLFSVSLPYPQKKIISAVRDIRVNPPMSETIFRKGKKEGKILFMPRRINCISSAKRSSDR